MLNDDYFFFTTAPEQLTTEEFLAYYNKMKEGDKQARSILIKHNIRLVINYVIRNFKTDSQDKKDLVSEGVVGLIKAIDNYNPAKSSFSTYAEKCIRNAILNYLNEENVHSKDTSIEEELFTDKSGRSFRLIDSLEDETDVADLATNNAYISSQSTNIKNAISMLSIREQKIVTLYYFKNYTVTEIADIYGISHSNVSIVLKKALTKLKGLLFSAKVMNEPLKHR